MKKIIFIITFLISIIITIFFSNKFETPDTPCYVAGSRMIFTLPGGADCNFSMNKPLPLFIAGLFESTTGLHARYGLFAQNLVFYFLSALLLFEIIRKVFKDKRQALLGALIFATAPPILINGLNYATDMSGWFFGILGIYLTLCWMEKFRKMPAWSFYFGLIMGLGLLFKESALVAPLFFGIYILLFPLPANEKIKIIFFGLIGFIIPILISQIITYKYFGYTFLDWYKYNLEKPYGDLYDFKNFIKAVMGTLHLYWILFFIGLYKIVLSLKNNKMDREILIFLISSGASILFWFIWPYPMSRTFFLSAPFLVSISSFIIYKY
ncbi:MAG: hypothetical protein US50_C0007G0006 [Candidatus Nomurabacteria bacterium GW2011_GWB1_37_5]|uniref:Glycosyltransferase RgtA/B/C/D-like domain-containing protein n=1 Tax=Candidatus Nomurabacteria bacterium GW2011_GWB1_37_5 TaxID=1618742 RepID=A0A0G0GXJ7_9BACT|nr:MAG: hypothetical protein US50_C0007G0006 [Candidatus Nomurabacteria bacterium GW2011_GWB1_37_5]